jgi:hypothetical protein
VRAETARGTLWYRRRAAGGPRVVFRSHYIAPDAYFFWTFLRALRFDGISTFQNSNIATRILIA